MGIDQLYTPIKIKKRLNEGREALMKKSWHFESAGDCQRNILPTFLRVILYIYKGRFVVHEGCLSRRLTKDNERIVRC